LKCGQLVDDSVGSTPASTGIVMWAIGRGPCRVDSLPRPGIVMWDNQVRKRQAFSLRCFMAIKGCVCP